MSTKILTEVVRKEIATLLGLRTLYKLGIDETSDKQLLVLQCCRGVWRSYFRFNSRVLPDILWCLASLMSVVQSTNTTDMKQTSRDSSAGVVTSPRPGQPKNLVSFSDNGQEFMVLRNIPSGLQSIHTYCFQWVPGAVCFGIKEADMWSWTLSFTYCWV
jgi:hypothetical protein